MSTDQHEKDQVFIGIGSNKGNRLKLIKQAIAAIGQLSGTKIYKTGRIYESAPIGSAKGKFLNTVIQIYTDNTPFELLVALKEIEIQLGRQPGPKWGDRKIDLDILLFGRRVLETDLLKIPHPELHRRDFVLLPLLDIAPELVHPTLSVSVSRLLETVTIQSNCNVKYKSLEPLPC
jgi:2-amino-4-hydroxy-6-hydroxymethyldihydropteridine diphosphokinase